MRLVKQFFASILLFACVAGCAQELERALLPDGGFVEYETSGDPSGEPVLMIHGAIVAAAFYPIMNEAALSDYYLIRYHRQGFGGSSTTEVSGAEREAEDALALLNHLGIEKAHVVAHSAGGRVALQLASSRPDVVHSLTLLEGGFPSTFSEMLERRGMTEEEYLARRNSPEGAARGRSATDPSGVDALLQQLYGDEWRIEAPKFIPDVIAQAYADRENGLLTGALVGETVQEEFFQTIYQPILYALRANAPNENKAIFQALKQHLPQAELVEATGVPNHAFQMRYPEATARLIAQWLSENPF